MPCSPHVKRRVKKKKKTYKPPKQPSNPKLVPTANAKTIIDLMKLHKVKGNFKDHVVIAGARLIDWLGSYDIVKDDDEMKTVGINGIAIIHKSKLSPVIGEEMAEKFWKFGMRTNMGVETRRTGCAKK